MNLGFSFDWNLSYSINWWWMSNWPDLVLQNVHLRWYIQVRHLFLSHLCKHLWVQGFDYDNIHSGCCSDKSGHLWERRDDGYLMSSSINGVRLLHAWLLLSFTRDRSVQPHSSSQTTCHLKYSQPFHWAVIDSKYINKKVPVHLRITEEEKSWLYVAW